MSTLASLQARRYGVGALLFALISMAAVLLPAGPVAATSPPVPLLTKVEPNHGPAAGGNQVTLTGVALDRAWGVRFGDQYVARVVSRTTTTLVVEAPSGVPGTTVDVKMGFDDGSASGPNASTADDYTYDGRVRRPLTLTPSHGSPAGGTQLTITGQGIDFSSPRSVTFGGKAAQIVASNASSVTVKTPAGEPDQKVQVEVTTAAGLLEGDQWSRFTYDWTTAPPKVTSVTPRQIYASGGEIEIAGDYLQGATKVTLGDREFEVFPSDATTINLSVPAMSVQTADVRVTTAVGTSPNTSADDLSIVASPFAPVITSVSPNRGSVDGETEVAILGRNLASTTGVNFRMADDGGSQSFQVVSDTELRAVTNAVDQPGKADVIVYSSGGSTAAASGGTQDDYTFEHQPTAIEVAPNHGPATGGTVVRLTGGNVNFWRAQRAFFEYAGGGRVEATVGETDGTWLDLTAPPGPAGQTATIKLISAFGDQINGAGDTYRWDGATNGPVSYAVAGTLKVPTVARGDVKIGGALSLSQQAGVVRGTMTFNTVTVRLLVSGTQPVTAKLTLAPSGEVGGTVDATGVTVTGRFRVKLTEAKFFGAIPIAIGNTCQSKQLASLTFRSSGGAFTWEGGGRLSSTFAVSDFNGCALLNGLFSPATASEGNSLLADLAVGG